MSYGGDGLAIGAMVVLGVGTAVLGSIGTVTELAVKEINKQKRPILRTIGEIFAKTLQTACGAVVLVTAASLLTNPIFFGASLGIGVVMILTPLVNGITQHIGFETLKKIVGKVDQVVNIASKIINTAVVTSGVFLACGVAPAVIGGLGLSALNIVTYKKD